MKTIKDTLFRNFKDMISTDSVKLNYHRADRELDYYDKLIEKYNNEKNNFFSYDEDGLSDVVDFEQIFNNKLIRYSGSNTYAQDFTKLKGFVTLIDKNFFGAKLFNEKVGGTYEFGEFDISDIDDDDLDLFSIGAVFYWTFGYFKINGQIKKMSEIRFQRISILVTSEVDDVIDEANKLNESISWD